MHWQTARFRIDLDQPRVMGIVNVTPDSFSDGGRYVEASIAMAHCEQLLREGADILDIGGESTRPGASTPSVDEELARVMPVLRHAVTLGAPVSVDTNRAEVMRAVLDAGADIVNDVWALRQPGALEVAARHPSAGVCLMHMQGEPGSMQRSPEYVDVIAEVNAFLADRSAAVIAAGIHRERLVLDPGIGFGKTDAHNLALLSRQRELLESGLPLLLGWSRKRTLGWVTGRSSPQDRVAASIAAALLAVARGARIVRVHDVPATVDAIKLWNATQPARDPTTNAH